MAKLTGTNPDQVPTNADLGTMAYQDKDNVSLSGGKITGDITVVDNKRIYFGTDNDMNIVHGGSNASINNTTGNLGYNSDQHIFGDEYGTERMRISSGGNVGIGTASPSEKLSVSGNMELYNDEQDGYIWFHDAGTRSWTIGSQQSSGNFVLTNTVNIGSLEQLVVTGTGEVKVTSGLLELDGNDIGGTQVTIADDAVASITPPRNGGFMFVTSAGNTDYPKVNESGLLFYDVGLSLYIFETSLGTGSDLDVSTSDVTGTTGTDGHITVAVQSGVIKIENRRGFSETFQITFM